MATYYDALGLTREASATEIRLAFKRLAMQFHPDRNPNNPQAEEFFKIINEAYHVLSDPLKKARYDARLDSHESGTPPPPAYSAAEEFAWREAQRKRYAQWQQTQQKHYTFDTNYFKIQGLAFLTFLVLSGVCFGIIHTGSYFMELKRAEVRQQKRALVVNVNLLFTSGKIEEAISTITRLHKEEPLDLQFSKARDSLVEVLRYQSTKEFGKRNYEAALPMLSCLKNYEFPPRAETLRKIGECQYNLGNYTDALQSLKQLLNLQPWNIEVIYQIGIINQEYLQNQEEALQYFALGKKIFRDNLIEIYGEAFEIVMNPADVADVYVEIFKAKAVAEMSLKNYKDALKDLNWVIYLRPNQAEPYKLRAETKVKIKSRFLLCEDLAMAKKLGAPGAEALQRKYCQ
jgi:tetratricopeptide (TPR) repeat protein